MVLPECEKTGHKLEATVVLACYSLTESAMPRENNISNVITSQVSASCQEFNVDRCQKNTTIMCVCVCVCERERDKTN